MAQASVEPEANGQTNDEDARLDFLREIEQRSRPMTPKPDERDLLREGREGAMYRPEFRVYNDPTEDLEDDLLPEYDFDYGKAKPNPYAARAARQPGAQADREAEGGGTPPLRA